MIHTLNQKQHFNVVTLVLSEMYQLKYITAEQYEQAINTPVTDGLQSLKNSASYPAYMDNYLKQVIEQVEKRNRL